MIVNLTTYELSKVHLIVATGDTINYPPEGNDNALPKLIEIYMLNIHVQSA